VCPTHTPVQQARGSAFPGGKADLNPALRLVMSGQEEERRAVRPGFDSQQCKVLLPSKASILVPEPTQPPIQWVPGVFPRGYSVKLTTHLYVVPKSRMVELCLHPSICLRVILFNLLSTRTTFHFPFFSFEFVRNISALDSHLHRLTQTVTSATSNWGGVRFGRHTDYPVIIRGFLSLSMKVRR
jgi:hypothetical protein